MWPPTFTRILLLSLLFCISLASAKKHEKILLSKVQSLTLRKGLKTTHRRVSAVPQVRDSSTPPRSRSSDILVDTF